MLDVSSEGQKNKKRISSLVASLHSHIILC